MVQIKAFITDEQWQRQQREVVLRLTEEQAQRLVQAMNENLDLRHRLWDVYCKAMRVIDHLA